MAASYPAAVKTFATRSSGQTIGSAHVNDIQDEINSMQSALLTTGLAHHLLFVDATYDIGASGSTRPRDIFLSRNATIGGTLAVTGVATFTAVPVFSAGLGAVSGTTGTFSSTATATSFKSSTATTPTVDVSGQTATSIANDATATLVTGVTPGLIVIRENTAFGSAAVAYAGQNGVSIIAAETAGGITYSSTADTASKINVYMSGGNLICQNKTGSTIGVKYALVRIY